MELDYMKRILLLDIDGVLNSNFWNDSHQRDISNGTFVLIFCLEPK